MKKLLTFSLILFQIIGCTDSDDNFNANCSSVACTNIYITLFVSVVNDAGDGIVLDRFEVTDVKTQEDITSKINNVGFEQYAGDYPIYDDQFVNTFQNSQRKVLFKGFSNGTIIAESEFTIDIDCCHVSLDSEAIIVVEN